MKEDLPDGSADAVAELGQARVLRAGDHPIPYSPPLEDTFFAYPEAIAASVRERLAVAR